MSQPALGEIYEGVCEDLAFGGDGIVRIGQFVVFIPSAVPGDRLSFSLTEIKPRFAKGKIREILAGSPQRTSPPCPIYSKCGGCKHQELASEALLNHKSDILQGLLRHGLNLEPIPLERPLASP